MEELNVAKHNEMARQLVLTDEKLAVAEDIIKRREDEIKSCIKRDEMLSKWLGECKDKLSRRNTLITDLRGQITKLQRSTEYASTDRIQTLVDLQEIFMDCWKKFE